MKWVLLIVSILVVLVIGALLFYFFYWRRRNDKPKITAGTIKEKLKQYLNFGSKEDVETHNDNKWTQFKENKAFNFSKLNNDITINEMNKLDDSDFKDIFAKPCESLGESIFDIETMITKPLSFGDELSGVLSVDEIDINKLDDVDNFANRFKNIESCLIPNKSNEEITLINNELF